MTGGSSCTDAAMDSDDYEYVDEDEIEATRSNANCGLSNQIYAKLSSFKSRKHESTRYSIFHLREVPPLSAGHSSPPVYMGPEERINVVVQASEDYDYAVLSPGATHMMMKRGPLPPLPSPPSNTQHGKHYVICVRLKNVNSQLYPYYIIEDKFIGYYITILIY